MSKVLFFNIPAYGHTYPTLPLTAELVRRGEQVIYYSSPAFQQSIEQTGAMYRDLATPILNDETQVDENMVRVAYMLLQNARLLLDTFLLQVREDAPDYIIHDGLSPWGKYIAQIIGVPSICSITTLVVPTGARKIFAHLIKNPEDMRLLFSSPVVSEFVRGRNELIPFRNLSNQLHKKYRLAKPQLLEMVTNHSMMNIVYATKLFQPLAEVFDDTFKFVGPSIVPRSDTAAHAFEVPGESPVIYISLGTVFNDKADFYRMCYEAFADINRTVVLSVGKRTDIASLGTMPRNFIVRDFVPQLELLQHTALYITHGGKNSVSEALYYGVPMIIVPQSADQPLVGRLIERLGAGTALRRESLTPQKLRSTAEYMLAEPTYQQASARIGKSFGQADGYLQAADEIQGFKQVYSIS